MISSLPAAAPAPNINSKMLGHSSAKMTLDVYAELFDDDLDGVAIALNNVVSQMNVLKMCSKQA